MELNIESLKVILSKSSSLGDSVLEFSADDTFDSQGIDSLDLLDYLLEVEEEFGVAIPDTDIDQVGTLNNLLAYLKEKV